MRSAHIGKEFGQNELLPGRDTFQVSELSVGQLRKQLFHKREYLL